MTLSKCDLREMRDIAIPRSVAVRMSMGRLVVTVHRRDGLSLNLAPHPSWCARGWFQWSGEFDGCTVVRELDDDDIADLEEMTTENALLWLRNRGVEIIDT